MLLYPSLIREIPSSLSKSGHDSLRSDQPTLKDLGHQISELFLKQCDLQGMADMSAKLQQCYLEKLQESTECMLPSFNRTMPTGRENGVYLACDVGGSTLRVALVELLGKRRQSGALKILHMAVSPIDDGVRQLQGPSFFAWMARKIAKILADSPYQRGREAAPLPLGLSWSFPVEQTSARSGKVQGMGKGFLCAHSVVGQELGGLIVSACRAEGLSLSIGALVNDSCATLLSRAYTEPSTSMSLILGTGTNMAIHLPVSSLGTSRLQGRKDDWLRRADMVTINTELSMFGKGILPETRWDDLLNQSHALPDFQPLEYMTAGRYLGEILRLVLAEAVEVAGLFDGHFPSVLHEPYSLDTTLLAVIERDRSCNSTRSASYLRKIFHLHMPPSAAEMAFLRVVVKAISERAAVYMAVAIHALWAVERKASGAAEPSRTTIVCNGSVIEKYPGFRSRCQDLIAALIVCEPEDSLRRSEVVLQIADEEAAILGAAVAVATGDGAQRRWSY